MKRFSAFMHEAADLIIGVPLTLLGLALVWIVDQIMGLYRHEDDI